MKIETIVNAYGKAGWMMGIAEDDELDALNRKHLAFRSCILRMFEELQENNSELCKALDIVITDLEKDEQEIARLKDELKWYAPYEVE